MRRLPNILSTLRIVLVPIFLVLYIQNAVVWRTLGIGVFAVAVLTDFVDGYIARLYHAQTSSGIFLDPLADKFLTFAGFACLPFIDGAQFPWWAVGVIIIRDVLITVMRIIADYRGIPMKTRWIAKFKTMSQMIFLYVVLLVGVFVNADVWLSVYCRELLQTDILGWVMMAVVILTVYSGLVYIVNNTEIFSFNNNAETETPNR
jgi:CDP-diacylglycerol--glycerol-3-phosphate 3-phosphatidyltransferase